jgi:uncharacterized membrane protein YraQ (UPF0718 family)
LPIEKLKNYLNRKKLFGLEYLFASIFGAITPFCSCSSVPLFIGFVQGGIPLGVTFAFLITSPLVNEVAIALFLGMFGLKATLIYAVSGIILGTIGGWILGKMNLEHLLSDWVKKILENKQKRENHRIFIIHKILNSNIDFSKKTWGVELSKILNKSPQYCLRFVKKYMKDCL